MQRNDTLWREHLDIITAWGQASVTNQTSPPTDEQLWAASRVRQDLHLPEQVDPELLAQLRAAFTSGRQRRRIDLAAVADALCARGHDAVVEHVGQGAILYAGRWVPDRGGVPRWAATAGPGVVDASGAVTTPLGVEEFAVGPDGDDAWWIGVSEQTTEDQLVDLIGAVIADVKKERARFAAAADAARDAMWAAFAARYPEVTTGDLPPGADRAFVAESDRLAGWLDDNRPDGQQPPAHLTALVRSAPSGSAPSVVGCADAARAEDAQ
ncbi:hypothetical protein [Virgisporangium aurantiacum]|uniref:Uncharacterized protein n=1 Tax=Virgisporangium aurantiacum TaxID=175570 RepID=A0A8J3ZFQ3_9ACTN|nr:hypothetical protein [Virgisporangium aurantiacum]GIJ62047.1 hypothetical protein Vau01_095630 [Virgisporangium aurantiacum]